MVKIKRIVKIIVFLMIFFLLFFEINEVLKRKTVNGAWNFSVKTGGFYNLESDSLDIVAIGSSHCYCSFNPLIFWEDKNIKSYVLSSQQQPIKASYYYVKEVLKTQKPKAILLEAYMANIDMTNPEEGVIRDAYEYFDMSLNKLEMIHALAPEGNQMEYYIDFIKYHSRWSEITVADFDKEYKKRIDDYRGYVFLTEHEAQERPEWESTEKINFIEGENLTYLLKILELSKQYDFQLILWYAPYITDVEGIANVNGVKKFAEENNIEFINTFEIMDQLNFEEDFYDSGHVNYKGAEKISRYLSEKIMEMCPLKIANTENSIEFWEKSLEKYRDDVEEYEKSQGEMNS